MERICRDCGRLGNEDPDDPAPALCPKCYEKRLKRITPLFQERVELLAATDGDITLAIAWLAKVVGVGMDPDGA
jgi:hypothetical protein